MDEDDVDTVVQPDVIVVCDQKKIRNNGIWGARDLVVEILSKSTSRKDQHEKFDLYERGGVREYWIVDPNGQWIQQYLREPGGKFGVEITFEKTGELAYTVLISRWRGQGLATALLLRALVRARDAREGPRWCNPVSAARTCCTFVFSGRPSTRQRVRLPACHESPCFPFPSALRRG